MSDFSRLMEASASSPGLDSSGPSLAQRGSELLQAGTSSGFRALTASELRHSGAKTGEAGFEHKSTKNIVLLNADPDKNEVRVRVLDGNGPERINGAGFTIKADGSVKPGSVLGLKEKTDLADKALSRDILEHTRKALALSEGTGFLSDGINAQWRKTQGLKRESGTILSRTFADVSGVTAQFAVQLGHGLAGSDKLGFDSGISELFNRTAIHNDPLKAFMRGPVSLEGVPETPKAQTSDATRNPFARKPA